jgi:hypothetical protein
MQAIQVTVWLQKFGQERDKRLKLGSVLMNPRGEFARVVLGRGERVSGRRRSGKMLLMDDPELVLNLRIIRRLGRNRGRSSTRGSRRGRGIFRERTRRVWRFDLAGTTRKSFDGWLSLQRRANRIFCGSLGASV